MTGTLPDDAVLPQLAAAFDMDLMARLFEGQLSSPPVDETKVVKCTVEWVKYKPRQNCLILYSAEIVGADAHSTRRQMISGRLYPPGQSATRYAKALHEPLAETIAFPKVMHLPSLDMVAWTFPNDRKLRHLDRMMPPGESTVDALVQTLDGDWTPTDVVCQLVHYVPEHTCCIRADVSLRKPVTEDRRYRSMFGKAYYNEQGERTARHMQALARSRACTSGRLSIPRLLSFDPDLRHLWQQGLPGSMLKQSYPDDRYDRRLIAALAKTFSALHGSGIACSVHVTADDLAGKLVESAQHAGVAMPAAMPGLLEAAATLQRTVPDERSDRAAVLHGDLHPKNILVHDQKIALIDLDNLMEGPALHDIGSFAAALLYRSVLRGKGHDQAVTTLRQLVAAYRQASQQPLHGDTLAWHISAALINERAHRCVSRLKPGRLPTLQTVAEMAASVALNRLEGETLFT